MGDTTEMCVRCRASPFSGTWTPNDQAGDPGAGAPTATLASTSSLVTDPETAYDDFSEVIAGWSREEAGPFSPHSGTHYLYSGQSDVAYMRLHRDDVVVPTSGPATLTFWASQDTEVDWDFFFVEAAQFGTDNWDTLPDTTCRSTPVRTPASRAGTATAGRRCTAA